MADGLTPEELAALDAAAEQAGVATASDTSRGGRWFVRPKLGIGWVEGEGRAPVWAGGEIGRSQWSLEKRVSLAGEARLSAQFPFGPETRGRDLRLGAFGGPTLGPIAVMLGPDASYNALSWPDGALLDAWQLGARLTLTADAGAASAFVGHEAWWTLASARPPADGGWPGLGDEPEWLAGAALRLGDLQLRVDASRRETAEGAVDRLGFAVRWQP